VSKARFWCLLAVGASLAVSPASPASAVPRCFGKPATIVGTPRNDSILGTDGVDVIVALAGDDSVNALGGRDLVCGGKGEDDIDGDHPDFQHLSRPDKLSGGPGGDSIIGELGDDLLIGGPGTDDLCGARGADRSRGGPGRDRFTCPFGDDVFAGGGGLDTVDFFLGPPAAVDLRSRHRQQTGWGNQRYIRVENLDGSPEADHFIGNAAPNFFWLADHNDVANGGPGPDRIIGGPGADDLAGGGDDDVLDGRGGTDSGNGGPHVHGDLCRRIEMHTDCEFLEARVAH
jgi:Ca2+-binding RTX toxin-like protein